MLFLLGSSKRQSRIRLRESVSAGVEVYPFQELTAKRVELINCFGISMEELLPAWRRYKNNFWDSLEFWVLPSEVQSFISARSLVLSPLLGLININSPIPYACLSWDEECKGKKLRDWWKEDLRNLSKNVFQGKTIVSLLGSEEEKILSFESVSELVKFEFYKKGQRVKNSQRHRAYALRYIAERKLSIEDFHKINFYDYQVKEVKEEGKITRVIFEGVGAYI
ncbi:peroxide stress protein YaaA [Thermocrinis sp.]|uniref:peroxide stress protein YaaA n=1 Tax=Thermocrinis sp. TaxID=2024383 RepID=UPI002FDE0E08